MVTMEAGGETPTVRWGDCIKMALSEKVEG